MDIALLKNNAGLAVAKTILAADESSGTIKKRLAKIGIESNPETNRQYRQLLFTAPNLEHFISGIIMYDETIRQMTDDGIPFPVLLDEKGILPGIKVDTGTETLEGNSLDTYTKGLEGLEERLKEYKKLGAKFAKWRAVYTIGDNAPSDEIIRRNAEDLARYANLCQEAGIVPIVEPEVLMDGSHSLAQDKDITLKILTAVFKALADNKVAPEGMILKPNMVTAGSASNKKAGVEEVAQATLDVLKNAVPVNVPGIAFLSGGQSPDLATIHLNAINQIKAINTQAYPWRITASYGRALQGEALDAWGGKTENIDKAQKIFTARAEKVYKASLGQL